MDKMRECGLLVGRKVKYANPNTFANPNTNSIPNFIPNPTNPKLQARRPAF